MGEPGQTTRHRNFRLTRTIDGEFPGPQNKFSGAFAMGLFQLVILLALTALLLDSGVAFRRASIAAVAYLSVVLLCFRRRRLRPTTVDLLFVKYAPWPLFVATCCAAAMMGRFG